jgi:membrane-bound serine protease (ClpP class)
MSANELLLNPNLAYLLLVVGGMLAILALFTPGTGVLEVGALFILILAGWQVYNLPINAWALALLVVGVVPFLLAMRHYRRVGYLVVAILAFTVGSSFLFRGESWWQPAVNPILAALASVGVGGFIWFTVHKVIEADLRKPSHDLGTLVGAIGETRTPVHEDGSVQVASELWTARSEEPIPASTKVRVMRRDGFVLEVEPFNEETSG